MMRYRRRPDLLRFAVRPSTNAAYSKALRVYFSWAKQLHIPSPWTQTISASQLDRQLLMFFNYQCFEVSYLRGNRQRCVNAKAAIIHAFPFYRERLPMSARALGAWDKLVPGKQHAPCPRRLMYVLLDSYLKEARLDMALLIGLCFFGYLRISEASGLQRRAIILPNTHSGGAGFLYLQQTKTGINQSAKITDPVFWELMRLYLARTQVNGNAGHGFLFNAELRRLGTNISAQLSRRCRIMGVDCKITAHSLRHGAATDDFINGRSVADIMEMGRWRSTNTLTRYLQAAKAITLSLHLPVAVVTKGQWIMEKPERLLRTFSN